MRRDRRRRQWRRPDNIVATVVTGADSAEIEILLITKSARARNRLREPAMKGV
jgi:hypothetical protein